METLLIGDQAIKINLLSWNGAMDRTPGGRGPDIRSIHLPAPTAAILVDDAD